MGIKIDNVLFYGNCQMSAIQQILNLDINYFNSIYVQCYSTELEQNEFDNILLNANYIITQHIKDNYRNKIYLSTKYILDKCNPNTKVILLNNCYFKFYHFDSITNIKFNNEIITIPIIYHYKKMMEYYSNGLDIKNYINNIVNEPNLLSSNELEQIANNGINELEKRYNILINNYSNYNNVTFIKIHDFIKNNYKNKLLFYTFNHPSKYLTQYICEQIVLICGFYSTINYNIDPQGIVKSIIYKCIQKNVNFNIDEYSPCLYEEKTNFDLTKLYYDTYYNIGFDYNKCIIDNK